MLNIPRNNEIAHVHFLCIDRHSKKTLESSSFFKKKTKQKMSFSIDSIIKIESWVGNKNKADYFTTKWFNFEGCF